MSFIHSNDLGSLSSWGAIPLVACEEVSDNETTLLVLHATDHQVCKLLDSGDYKIGVGL